MSFGSTDHPFYRPLWRRLAIIAVTAVWAALEIFRGGEPMWMVIAGGAFAYSLWTFLITWKDPVQTEPVKPAPPSPPDQN